MKTVLITGVSGFIGGNIARFFAVKGWDVVGIGLADLPNSTLQYLRVYESMFLPSSNLKAIITKNQPNLLVHCAGKSSVVNSIKEPIADFHSTVNSTFDILENLRNLAPECKFIYLSSAAVYGNPTSLPIEEVQPPNPISPYGFHKLISENVCKEFSKIYGLNTAILRIFSAYGIGLKRQVIWDICEKSRKNNKVNLSGTGNESRDFINIDDIARAIYIAYENSPFEANIYNLGSGTEITVQYLAETIIKNLENNNIVLFDGKEVKGNPLNWQADISSIKSIGFEPRTSIELGIFNYCQWYRSVTNL